MNQELLVTDSLDSREGKTTLDVLIGLQEATVNEDGSVDLKRIHGMPTYAFIDVETTGFDPLRNGVLTLACYVTDAEYNLVGEHYGEFRPDGKKEIVWGDEASKVHGISWERASSFPDHETASEEFLLFIEQYPALVFIAHNCPFDRRMVRGTLSKSDRHFRFYQCFPRFQDTIKLVKSSGLVSSKTKSLGAICKELGIEHNHHDARSDAKVLIEIHKRCTEALGKENILGLSEENTAAE